MQNQTEHPYQSASYHAKKISAQSCYKRTIPEMDNTDKKSNYQKVADMFFDR